MATYVVVLNPYGDIGNLTGYGPVMVINAKTSQEAKSIAKKQGPYPIPVAHFDAYRAGIIKR